MRLDKLIEKNLNTSRKETKRLFLRGAVEVDGQIERKQERNVDSRLHKITVSNKILTTSDVYYLLHKPAGVVTANKDQQHQTVIDLLQEKDRHPALYAVGRLDRDTEGLLLLTSNGQLGYELLRPNKKVEKIYEAWILGNVTSADVTAFQKGIVFIGGEVCQPAQLTILTQSEKYTQIRLKITEGKFHQVKKMFLARGKKVCYLRRIAMGPLKLPQTLAKGDYRDLTARELLSLKKYFR